MRIGGGTALVGGVMVLAGNAIHPRESGQLDNAEALLSVAANSPIWAVNHLILMVAIVLLLAAYYGLTHSITKEPGSAWARLGWGIAIVGAGIGVLFMLTEAVAVRGIADTWATSSGAQQGLALAAGDALFHLSLTLSTGGALFFFGICPIVVGKAVLGTTEYPDGLGWLGMVLGMLGVAVNGFQIVTGVTTSSGLIIVPVSIIGVTLWLGYSGVLMLRRSAMVEVPVG
ncbi:MAG TPA: hypothetical protein VFY46_04155 [Acidimicrobiia bacterium]|nr:hypothetical protein [Acidimicrobiia bacterium]